MDNQRNVLSVDFQNNNDLKSLMSSWTVGKEYPLKLRLQLDELTPDGAKFSIKEVTSEEQKEEDKDIEPDAQSPVMMVMTAGTTSGGAPAAPYVAA